MHHHIIWLALNHADSPVFLVPFWCCAHLDDFIIHFCLAVSKTHCIVSDVQNLLQIHVACSFLLKSGFPVFSHVSCQMLLTFSMSSCVCMNMLLFLKLLCIVCHACGLCSHECCTLFPMPFWFFATESHNLMSKLSGLNSL